MTKLVSGCIIRLKEKFVCDRESIRDQSDTGLVLGELTLTSDTRRFDAEFSCFFYFDRNNYSKIKFYWYEILSFFILNIYLNIESVSTRSTFNSHFRSNYRSYQ